jgi:chemotaxis protein methyltransferase CheR
MQEYTANYLRAGGKRSFSEYYTAAYDGAIFRPHLHENVIFSQHNLAMDSSFNEFHVILCRNVMIYFNERLQERVHNLLHASMVMFGVLGLGQQETIRFNTHEASYEELAHGEKLYRRVA